MGLVLLDSSVLIAIANPSDTHHHRCVHLLKECGDTVVAATISITETLSSPLMRSYEFALDLLVELHNMVERFINLDAPIAFKAAEIRAIQKMTLGDAIISATADAVNAELWTCDRELAKKSKNARLLL